MEQSPPNSWGEGISPVVQVHFSRWMLAFLALLLIGPWLVVAWLWLGPRLGHATAHAAAAEDLEPQPEPFVAGKPGPWGVVETRPIRIELPDEFVFVPPATQPPVRWLFKGYSKERTIEFLRSSGLTEAQLEQLEKAGWKTETAGASIEPGDDLVLSLTPEARAKVYSFLVEISENSRCIDPIWFRPGQVDARLKDSGLDDATIELLKGLLYPQGEDLLLFADFEPAVRRVQGERERHEFMQALSRKRSLLARLRIGPDSDVNEVINYWSAGGRRKDVGPLLHAVKREGQGTLGIISLLPRFMRNHLYNHPFTTTDPSAVKQDCFWSAMNAFSDVPDNRFNDMAYVKEVLMRDYYSIVEPSQLGDLIFLTTRDETVIHAASYVADDIVFTKNGASYTQPWILMHHQDMYDTYVVRYPLSGPLKVLYFRRKAS
jgi:hypothetical protein